MLLYKWNMENLLNFNYLTKNMKENYIGSLSSTVDLENKEEAMLY